VPKENHDRTIVVHLTPDAVLVDYRLEVDEYRALKDLEGVDLGRLDDRRQVHAAYLRHLTPVIRNNLVVELDGKELELTCTEQSYRLLDHVRCDWRFRAAWRLSADRPHRFRLRDANFHDDTVSAVHLSLAGSPELTLSDVVAPDDELLRRPPDRLAPGDRDRVKRVSATVRAVPSFHAGLVRPALPPDPDPARPGARGRARRLAGVSKPVPAFAVASVRDRPPPGEEEPPASRRLLDLLLDTRQGLGVLLLLAAGFGAVHALTPGHGKTMVAAYLVGERGTAWHAVVLGLVTTLTHTAAVLVLAAVLPLLFPGAVPGRVQMILGLVGGLLIAGLGLWLLLVRLAGGADHVHLIGGHHHHHGGEEGETQPAAPGWWGLVVLGISGGIVPCWDAIAMLGLAISAQRLWLGLPLLLAFSAGLAGVLVALGLAVVRARDLAGARLEGERFRRLIRALPIVSALVITALGLWLCYESARLAA
jgi:ABC-type nickel/cobalt efflux system permease component RcnA